MTASNTDKDDQKKLDSLPFPKPPKKEVLIESFFPCRQKPNQKGK